jgi:hypothetical protein
MKRLQSSEPLHAKMPLIVLLVGIMGFMGINRNLFRRTGIQKCGRESTIVLWTTVASRMFEENKQPAIQIKKKSSPLAGFFN